MKAKFRGAVRASIARMILTVSFIFWAAGPAMAQGAAIPQPPAGYVPLAVTPCGQVGQPVSLDLSTTSVAGVDGHWAVSGPAGAANYGGPYAFHTSHGSTAAQPNNWVQPAQSATLDANAPPGQYTYTIWHCYSLNPTDFQSVAQEFPMWVPR
jgi:hypothetical protein